MKGYECAVRVEIIFNFDRSPFTVVWSRQFFPIDPAGKGGADETCPSDRACDNARMFRV